MIKRYTSKPIEFTAIQWTGFNIEEIEEYTQCRCDTVMYIPYGLELWIETNVGNLTKWLSVLPGGYVSRDEFGIINVWQKEYFENNYLLKED